MAWVVAAVAVVVTVQQYARDGYNNYSIFASSLKVLLSHESLYVPHPALHDDLYKYSPTFPLFMAPFTWQPAVTGLLCWNLLNALALVAAVRAVLRDDRRVLVATAILLIELVTSLQNTQSNALVAALVVFAFVELERKRPWSAGLLIAGGFFLKVYGAAVAVLAVLYPRRVRVAGATVAWTAVLACAPLVVLSWPELVRQYAEWVGVSETFPVARNASVMRVWARYIDADVNPLMIQGIGALIFLAPFARVRAWRDPAFRLGLLCSLLVALVIFNNSAEPPTYIIAVTGGALWYAAGPNRSRLDGALWLAVLLAVSLVSTDVYPRAWRATFAGPYSAKAVGCLLLWVRITWDLMTARSSVVVSRS